MPSVGAERYRAPEILFDPEIIGLEYILASTKSSSTPSTAQTWNCDKPSSATSCSHAAGHSPKDLGSRLLHEVQRLAVKDMRIKIFAPPERKYSTWIGGSFLAGLSTFRKVSYKDDDDDEKSRLIGVFCGCGSISKIGTRILILFIRNLTRYPNSSVAN